MLQIKIDYEDILQLSKMEDVIKADFKEIGAKVAEAAYAYAVEEAKKRLHSRQGMYIEALFIGEQDGVHLLVLDAKAVWIEDGQPAFNMLEKLLSSPKAKTGKNGKYLAVPFNNAQGSPPAAQQNLIQTVTSHFKSKGIDLNKIETHADGTPKTGLLHKFDMDEGPLRDSPRRTYQGHGKFGKPVQGHSGIPFLKGVRVYQKQIEDKKTGKSSIQRFVGTFRMASESQVGSGKWDHPGNSPIGIFKDTEEYVKTQFDKEWAGKLLDSIIAKL